MGYTLIRLWPELPFFPALILHEESQTVATPPPPEDVPGEDITGLPRYPGSVRAEYDREEDGGFVETKVAYVSIPEDELPHIFERFYRVDKTRTRKQGGTGLGLPIAKAIVEVHGGRIEAESRVGEGTGMSIYLPLIADPQPTNGPVIRVNALDER